MVKHLTFKNTYFLLFLRCKVCFLTISGFLIITKSHPCTDFINTLLLTHLLPMTCPLLTLICTLYWSLHLEFRLCEIYLLHFSNHLHYFWFLNILVTCSKFYYVFSKKMSIFIHPDCAAKLFLLKKFVLVLKEFVHIVI